MLQSKKNRYAERLENLQSHLKEQRCDTLVIQDEINLYYLTGLSLSAGSLLVHPKGAELLVDGRYEQACKESSPFPVHPIESGALATLIEKIGPFKTLGFNSNNFTYSNFLTLEKEIAPLTGLTLLPLEGPVEKLRTIKDEEEISLLKEASALGSEGFDYLLTLLREGISEIELAIELEIFWKRKGSKALAFDPIIAFGTNSAMPHYRASGAILQKNQAVLLDIGVCYKHYHSDMTRVVYFGQPDPKMLAIHKVVLEAQEKALQLCRPGVRAAELDAAARDHITDNGFGQYFTHSLGHGIGLEIHEQPFLRNKPPAAERFLQEGMVVTIEPGIYLPGVGGVRIEDSVLLTPQGHENLTNRAKEAQII